MGTAVIFKQVLALLLMMGVGLVARKRGLIDDRLAKGVTGILLGISLPALILLSFNIEPDPSRMRSVVAVVLASVIFHAIMLPGAALGFRRWGRDRRNVLVFLAHFPNVGFMGMPLVFAIFGAEGVFYASLFMIPFNIVMWTYGQGLFLNAEEAVSWRTRLTNPIILSIAAGIALFLMPWSLPDVVFKPLQMLGSMTTPLAMIVIGDMIGRSSPRGMFTDRDVLVGMSVRLIMAP